LIGGFAAARYTHNRKVGGAIWAAAGLACGPAWRKAGTAKATALGASYAAAMGGSHPLAKKIGAWPSVFVVSAVMSVLGWALADRS
jgi:hypothetical protein